MKLPARIVSFLPNGLLAVLVVVAAVAKVCR